MKSVQKITSITLAVIFLLSGLGFTANKMVCLKSGKTKLSLVHVKACCPEKKSDILQINSKCCDLKNTFFQLGSFQSSQKCIIENPAALSILFLPSYSFKFLSFKYVQSFFISDSPFSISGRQLLSCISKFTI